MPPTKITRSARHAPKPKGPVFPIRKPKLVTAADAQVAPINAGKVKAHYTKHGRIISWGILILFAVIGVMFYRTLLAGVSYVILQHHERQFAVIGADLCTRPLMTVPEYTCTVGELDCFTVPQEATIKRYEQQARAHNLWQAEHCLPLM